MNKFRVEEWTERECELLNEMKDRCLNGGKYKDEKAKEKFKMICHLEDYCVQYYQLLDYINQLETNRDEAIEFIENIWYSKRTTNINDIGYTTNKFLKIKEILERGKDESNI